MAGIEINTAQNVYITYEIAEVKDRVFAFIIDLFIIFFSIGVLRVLFSLISSGDTLNLLFGVATFLYFIFYTLFQEINFKGQTIGKRALGIKVIHMSGKEPAAFDYVTRWVFRAIDIYGSSGIIGLSLINAGERGQRLGGLLSNTMVIKAGRSEQFNLPDILNLQKDTDKGEVRFPKVESFKEEEMLTLKRTIDRYHLYNNDSHKDLLNEAAQTTAKRLGLKKVPDNKESFLRNVIKDYVIITRS